MFSKDEGTNHTLVAYFRDARITNNGVTRFTLYDGTVKSLGTYGYGTASAATMQDGYVRYFTPSLDTPIGPVRSPFVVHSPDLTATMRISNPWVPLYEMLATDIGSWSSNVALRVGNGFNSQKTILTLTPAGVALSDPLPVTSGGTGVTGPETSINSGVPNGAGALLHWSRLLGVPPGFSDGTDDGTITSDTLAYAASVTPTTAQENWTIGTLTGNITINNPTGSKVDWQKLKFRFNQDATGGRATTWGNEFAFGTDVTAAMIPTTANANYEMTFEWNVAAAKWRALAIVRGF